MAEITASMVKELRERTGVGMMECRKALVEADGQIDGAIKWLRERGISKAESKASRETREGIIYSYIHFNGKIGVMLELNCESDFVARTPEFAQIAEDIALQIAATNPLAITAEEIDPAIIEKEREIAKNKAINEGKKPEFMDKIIDGNIKKFCAENCLMEQKMISDEARTIKDMMTDAVAKTGENIQLARFVRYSLGGN
ncbi:MAG TPA: translation elongation factor Ts [Candidatus Cloacimonadota bacterium]|nr:translation elongation factor Ts [Candidatus Cloacimonadota bacterium]